MTPQGQIFEIQRLAMYDGPGLRTVVYLKGCPLRCLWCHNPEGQRPEPALFYHPERCQGCGRCAGVCPTGAQQCGPEGHRLLRARCQVCGACAAVCLNGALVQTGTTVSADALLEEVLGDRPFFRQGGGLTLSGGEPLAQPDFACALLAGAKAAGIHTCVETCGHQSPEALRQAAAVTDLFLYDIKELDPARHKQYTGVDNRRILENLALLNRLGKRVILRCPIIPGLNQTPAHFQGLGELARRLDCVEAVELEPYHPLGLSKYRALGLEPPWKDTEFLPPEALAPLAAQLRETAQKPVRRSDGEPI